MLNAMLGIVEAVIYELHLDGKHAVMQYGNPARYSVISTDRAIEDSAANQVWLGNFLTLGPGLMRTVDRSTHAGRFQRSITVHALCYTVDDAILLLDQAPLYTGIGNLPTRYADGPLTREIANELRLRLAKAEAAAVPINSEEREELQKLRAERVFLLDQCLEADDKLEQVTEWFNGREPLPDFLREECESDVLPTLVRPK